MSKKETVEVTIKVPKSLMRLLEEENYLGYERDYFFEAAIRAHIGGTVRNYHYEKEQKFFKKYGKNIDVFHLPEGLCC